MRKLRRPLAVFGGALALGAASLVPASQAFATDVPQPKDLPSGFSDGSKKMIDWLEPGTDEFTNFLQVMCGRTKTDLDNEPKYYETAWSGGEPSPASSQPGKEVKADNCEFVPDEGEEGDHTTDKLQSFVDKGNSELVVMDDSNSTDDGKGNRTPTIEGDPEKSELHGLTYNCTNIVQSSHYRHVSTKEHSTNWSISVGVEASIFKIFTASVENTVGKTWSEGTQEWDSADIRVQSGYKGWLEKYQQFRVVKGKFKINFPDRVKGHYEWHLNNFEIKTPSEKGFAAVPQSVKMTDKEIDKYCETPPDPQEFPSSHPSDEPSDEPTDQPSDEPTTEPTAEPTAEPTDQPTGQPTDSVSDWQPQTFYAYGAKVTFDGVTYRCLQEHQSNPGWEPPKTPSLWQKA